MQEDDRNAEVFCSMRYRLPRKVACKMYEAPLPRKVAYKMYEAPLPRSNEFSHK